MEILIIFIIIFVVIASASNKAAKNQEAEQKNKADNRQWKQMAGRVSAAANKVMNEILMEDGVSSPETENMSASERIKVRRAEERNTTILQRAKGNVAETKEDVTLNSMEAEHNHSERVSAAVHDHPEDILSENMLGSIEDLMIKGYGGNLCFERDFVGEAMDMISRFTVPSEIPDFSKEEAS